MTDQKRRYRMNARAESQQATRLRITEAAVELHGTLGPSRTSMSAVAEHAGVERSTLYRHFPDEGRLFEACSAHWRSLHPLPDLDRWRDIDDPAELLRTALTELYAYYAGAEPMLTNILRDVDSMEALRRQFAGFLDYVEAARATLLAGRHHRGRAAKTMRAAIGHALAFTTWRSLVREQGCTAAEAVELMCALAATASTPRRVSSRS
jgi:AcrR family transcriptional regulator